MGSLPGRQKLANQYHMHLQIKTETLTVTPAMAERWLAEHNRRIEEGKYTQRNVSEQTVRRYTTDMKNGQWAWNPQPIVFDENGNLQDGQHRLWAVAKSGASVDFQVLRGSPVKTIEGVTTLDVIDRGRPRSIAQQLSLRGTKHAIRIAAGAVAIAAIAGDKMKVRLSMAQVLFILEELNFKEDLTNVIVPLCNTPNVAAGIYGAIAWYGRVRPRKAADFLKCFVSLENLSKGHPALALVRWVQSNRLVRQEQAAVAKVVAVALWAFDEGRTVDFLRPSEEAWTWLRRLNKAVCDQIVAKL